MEISVIVPVYNCEKYLPKCINSILNQTFDDFELILINNGSVDDSAKICVEYKEKDHRVQYMLRENAGNAGAPRNTGLDAARGNYVIFVDADDYLEPNALEILYKEMISMDYDMVIAGYHNFSDEGINEVDTSFVPEEWVTETEVRKYFAGTFPNGEVGYLWNKIYKRDIIEHFQIRFPSTPRLQDGFFNVEYFSHMTKCKRIEEMTYHYRLSVTSNLYKKFPSNYHEMIADMVVQYYHMVEDWGFEAEEYEGELVKFALNEFEVCFENAQSGNWDMTRAEKMAYFKSLRDNELVIHLLSKRKYVKRYVRFVMFLFHFRCYHLIFAVVSTKLWAKKHMKGFFAFVKKILN